jgi:Nup85 nucleoporin
MSYSMPWPSDPSEPPSTPDRRPIDPVPSTTPAGPPPSASKSMFFAPSSKPRDSPDASKSKALFGQSIPAARASFWGNSPGFGSPKGSQGPSRSRNARFPPSSPPHTDNDDRMMDEDENPESLVQISPGIPTLASSLIGGPRDSMRGTKRTRPAATTSPEKAKNDIRAYAKGYAAANPVESMEETDDFILGTESILEGLETEGIDLKDESQAQAAASQIARELIKFWTLQDPISQEEVKADTFGLNSDAPVSVHATLLASLILPLHHPSAWESKSDTKSKPGKRLSQKHGAKSIPEVLFGWLAAFHQPGADVVDSVLASSPEDYATNPQFWDAAISSLLTGKLETVVELIQNADFRKPDFSYTNPQLDYIDDALDLMVDLLAACPAVASDDWDIKGATWGVFRHQVRQTQDEFRKLFEGKEGEAENISKSQLSFSLSRSSRMVESCLPQDIYDALCDMCEVMLGNQSIIFNSCYDWIEGVVTLTAWWDGEEDENLYGSTRNSRRRQSRVVDVTPTFAYRQHLSKSFQSVLDEEDLASSIDFMDPLQLAMCCIFEGDNEGLFAILQSFSLVVASATVQIAKIGGWLSESGLDSKILHGLDQSDLMVLSYANAPKASMKDEILAKYAQLLAKRDQIVDQEDNRTIEGWELALMTLARFDDPYLASQKVSALLKKIPLTSREKVNKLLELCSNYGFAEQAAQVAEVYISHLQTKLVTDGILEIW